MPVRSETALHSARRKQELSWFPSATASGDISMHGEEIGGIFQRRFEPAVFIFRFGAGQSMISIGDRSEPDLLSMRQQPGV